MFIRYSKGFSLEGCIYALNQSTGFSRGVIELKQYINYSRLLIFIISSSPAIKNTGVVCPQIVRYKKSEVQKFTIVNMRTISLKRKMSITNSSTKPFVLHR